MQHGLAADARHKADLPARRGLAAALGAISPALSVSEDGGHIVVDKLTDARTSAVGDGVTFSPVRRRLARTLSRGDHTTTELARAWQLTDPAVSRHLAVLRKAGLVEVSRRGRYVLHRLNLAACARLGADFVEAVLR